MTTRQASIPSVRTGARTQLPAIVGAVFVTLLVFGVVVVQLPRGGRPPSQRQVLHDELAAIVQERRVRITELQAAAPTVRCHPPSARDLARLLVMDGQGPAAQRLADDYEQRCGDDPIVHKWGYAPRPRPRR
jgi:hypothetical protein